MGLLIAPADQLAEAFGPSHGPLSVHQIQRPSKHGVAREQFVPAQSAQGDREPRLFCGLGDDKRIGSIATGVVRGCQGVGNGVEEIGGPEPDFVVVRSTLLGHQAGVSAFVEGVFFEGHIEGGHGALADFRHQGDHGTGVDAAGEKGAERDVGPHAQGNAVGEQVLNALGRGLLSVGPRFAEAGERFTRCGRIPPDLRADFIVIRPQQVAGRQGFNPGHQGARSMDSLVLQEIDQPIAVQPSRDPVRGQKRPDFTGPHQSLV